MHILGIDYGRKKIGLAFAEGRFAEPLKVLRYQDIKILNEQIKKIASEYETEKIVVGISEGKMAKETKEFGRMLKEKLKIPIVFQDETLTTKEAQGLSIMAGVKRKKRRSLEDAYSASIILQNYLDSEN